MPIHRYGFESRHERSDLVDLLAEELREDIHGEGPSRRAPEGAPDIYIRLYVSVIWSLWENVPETQRPAIILDAFQKAGRRSETSKIAVAMGLTPHEARALGERP